MKDVLINHHSYFSKENIEKIKKDYKFSQNRHIELLVWDFEIFAQMSAIHNDFVLKGGAATQIYLEPEKQRASRDIDFATTLTKKEVEGVLEKIRLKFESHKTHEDHFKWSIVPAPKDPAKTIEDLDCYDIIVPAFFGKPLGQTNITELRIDAIHYKQIPFVIKELKEAKVFGMPIKPFKIVSEGSLIADKLLTLADHTIGVFARNPEKVESYLKQLYDLTHLIDKFITGQQVQNDILETLKKLTPLELKYKGLSKSVEDVLKDIVHSLEKRKYVDYDSSEAGIEFRGSIDDFQGNYINNPESVPSYEWAARIGRIQFIAQLLLRRIEGKLSETELGEILKRLKNAEQKLADIKGDELKKVRANFMQYFKGEKSIEKQLKNAFLKRVLFGIITQENAEELFKSIGV